MRNNRYDRLQGSLGTIWIGFCAPVCKVESFYTREERRVFLFLRTHGRLDYTWVPACTSRRRKSLVGQKHFSLVDIVQSREGCDAISVRRPRQLLLYHNKVYAPVLVYIYALETPPQREVVCQLPSALHQRIQTLRKYGSYLHHPLILGHWRPRGR